MLSLHRPYLCIPEVTEFTDRAKCMIVHSSTTSETMTLTEPQTLPVFDNFTVGAVRLLIHGKLVAKAFLYC